MNLIEKQILDLMLFADIPKMEGETEELLQPYACTLAAIARKITQGQLTELITFGVAMRQRGTDESQASIETGALLKRLREWKN